MLTQPEGERLVMEGEEETFLFAPCPPVGLLSRVLREEGPALVITNEFGGEVEREGLDEEARGHLGGFLRSRSTRQLGEFELSNWMHGMYIFWKSDSEDGEGSSKPEAIKSEV